MKNYQNITEEEAQRLERELSKKIAWFRKELPTRWDRLGFKETAERLNSAWKDPSFWRLPKNFHAYDFPADDHPEFKGRYTLPVNVLASEKFYNYLESKLYLTEINKLERRNVNSSRQELEKNKNSILREIQELQADFFREVLHVAGQMQEMIETNSGDSIDYEPLLLSQNGEITQQRIELIGRAEDTYRGVICGSQFATDYLLQDFIFKNHAIINVLKDLQDKLLDASKTYLAIQMMDEYFVNPAGSNEKLNISEKETFIQGVAQCIEDESLTLPYKSKPFVFITPTRKIKPTTIGKYVAESMGVEYSPDHLRRKVRKILPSIESVEKRGKHFFKKPT